ncbi:hypothetical protein FSP39_001066 [Pinctada imbricata]|uniref:Uncharacterized protein n=1 Tax=Pinctada imbricata TaxID=66713 RepID=A0AA88YGP4_PINIB|nr:hypothetical protein FSP39_001066 [Pinctada imbricata]
MQAMTGPTMTSTPLTNGPPGGQAGIQPPASPNSGTFLPDGDISRIVAAVKASLMNEFTNMLADRLNPIIMCVNQVAQENKILHKRIDELEQYGRKNCVRIFGVPESESDSTQAVMNLAKDLNVPLEKNEVLVSHRVGRSTESKPRAIIARISSYESRHQLIKNSYKLSKIEGRRGVSINQDLTKLRSKLAKECRQLVKMNGAKSTFVFDGKIFLVDKNERKHKINGLDDLLNYKMSECPALARSDGINT